jgi:UDP-GlcNAc:undecaprenyl-phosphate GlcNAc-1-phosphate transferase
MTTYLLIWLGSLALALAATPVVIWLARRVDAVDRPGVRTVHTRPVPRIGGIAIVFSAVGLIAPVLFLDNRFGDVFREVSVQVITLLGAATLIFLVGLVDDVRGLPARIKLIAEVIAAALLCFVGVRISELEIADGYVLSLGWWGAPLTILWIVGITNAVNLSDGLDGLAAGVSAVACAVIAVFAIYSESLVMAVFMLALLGGLCGFLFYNFNPAKIFMGDCGSLFVGFTIAAASAMCLTKSSALVGLALPVLALGIPIFDALFAILRRFLQSRSLFAPDRSHFHHRLIDLGLKQRYAVLAIYGSTCVATGLGLFMMVRRDIGALVLFACVLLLLLLLFRVVGAVRLRETLAALQSKYATACQQRKEQRTFEDLELQFRRVQDRREWWQAVCEAGKGLDFAWVSLMSRDDEGNLDTQVWRASSLSAASRIVTMSLPVKGVDTKTAMEFEVAIAVNQTLESAGRRGALFSRLIDKHGPIQSTPVARAAAAVV